MAVATEVRIPLDGGASMRGLLALPEGEAPEHRWPAIVAIHDIVGFGRDIRRIARRLADSGYAALAPALYDGAGAAPLCVARTLRDSASGDGPSFERLEAARGYLCSRPEIDSARIGVTGFCMGGGFAIYWAARGGLQVAAPFYGNVPDDPDALRRSCPVIAGYGALDKPFVEQGRRLAKHLEALGVPHDVKIYEGVGHSYMNDHGSRLMELVGARTPMRARYDEHAAEDSWRRMLGFFGEHL
jgi:carboxymethylenebutenolidase